ncbi:MAG: hypothetical protein ACI9OJ_002736 [Myxococcota bacterium]|jgi:hypothetical protein
MKTTRLVLIAASAALMACGADSETSSSTTDTVAAVDVTEDAGTQPEDAGPEDVEADDVRPDTGPIGGPLDDVLRMNHLQALGTHNSYHLKPDNADMVAQWNYEHLPLDQQLGDQGVRQFELDIYYDPDAEAVEDELPVVHLPVIDPKSTCPNLSACVAVLKQWSDENLGHHPILILVETKFAYDEDDAQAQIDRLDQAISSVWPNDRLVTPAMVMGDSPDLKTALATRGWPTLGELRGRALFVLHESGKFRDDYLARGLDKNVLFSDSYGDTSRPSAAYHSMNSPSDPNIATVVNAGHLVRTRSDSDSENLGFASWEKAIASGAHFISTDYPGTPYGDPYAVNIPGGTPSGCNPLSAPDECTSEAIENLK